jgi:endonuclease YncB( thermonuclease family)
MLGLAVALALFAFPALADDITGKVRIIDGDTLEVGGKRIRLHGIDAPEAKQTCSADGKMWHCGEEATFALAYETAEHWVTCKEKDRDRYRRIVAVCYMGPHDLNALMVRNGWALAYRQYSTDYVDEEVEAQKAGAGIWRGKFIPPWEWRRGARLAHAEQAESPAQRSGNCLIKGNVSRSGERIYHAPGGQYYSRTKIDPSKGERWFCTEEEATAAGWRKSSK